jgi:Ca2+-binding EF-hand superfamily protein
MTKQQLILVFTLATLSGSLLAQEQRSRGNPLADLDSDGDGNISFPEFQQGDNPGLDRLDGDGDGLVSLEEFLAASPGRGPRNSERETDEARLQERQARMEQRQIARFEEMDLDGDGLVSKDEAQESTFLRLDRDGNNLLSGDELRPRRGMASRGERGERGGRSH